MPGALAIGGTPLKATDLPSVSTNAADHPFLTFLGLRKTKTGTGHVTLQISTKFSGILDLCWEFLWALP
eukprot:10099434-Ditylum_brightwellii.AAC.1